MKRFATTAAVALLVAGGTASSAIAFPVPSFNYVGNVKGEPGEFVGFLVKSTAGGHKRVARFTVTQIPYTCTDAPSGTTAGWRFEPSMQVQPDRTFQGNGDWIDQPLDPVGRVSGKLRPGGVATGQFKIRGELAGPGTHCRTGLLDWRATRQQSP